MGTAALGCPASASSPLLRMVAEVRSPLDSRGGCRYVSYHVAVHSLAERVLSLIRRDELLTAGDRVGVAVSGGIDSVALLRLLLELRNELGIVVSVVHFNHRLRGAESDADQEFVANLVREHGLEFQTDSEDVAARAAEEHASIETVARELRYGFFRHLLGEDRAAEGQGLKPDLADSALRRPEGRLFHQPALRGPEVPVFHQPALGGPEEPVFHQPTLRGLEGPVPHQSTLRGPEGPVLHQSPLNKIVTGHTLDDQAETVLMRMIRGAGLRGLGGIHPRIVVEDDDGEVSGEIVRPLLAIRRRELEQYLKDIGQPWREDSTNADDRFTRNRVRKLVVPLLEHEFNPSVAENLSELAEIARGEEDYWENEISGWLGTTVQWSEPDWAKAVKHEVSLIQIAPVGNPAPASKDSDLRSRIESAPWLVMNAAVSRMWFLGEPIAVQRRLVKAIGEHAGIPLEFKHVEEILRAAVEDSPAGKELSLPLGWKLVRQHDELVFLTPDLRETSLPKDYEYELPLPGQINVYEAGASIAVRRIPADGRPGYNSDHLLDAESVPGPLRVRNWRAGDRFWPAHTKSPKKIKELLQEHKVAQPERRFWPVVVSGDEIVWVRGFSVPAKVRAKPGRAALLIVDTPLADGAITEN